MSSKQQPARPSSNASSASTQSEIKSWIFSNISFDGDEEDLLKDLRRNYRGIVKVTLLGFHNNNEQSIDAIRIDVKSDDFAKQVFEKNILRIYDTEHSIKSSLTRSIIVSKISVNDKSANIAQDLLHNYLGLERILRFYDVDGNAVDVIRIDFKSDVAPTKILKDKYILIDGKRRPIQPYWSLVTVPKENQKVKDDNSKESQMPVTERRQQPIIKKPQKYLTEQRVRELFQEQQMQLESMINEFDNKWNQRLSSLTNSSANTDVDPLVPIMKDLTMVCQQFTQQNAQIQRQLASVVNRVQNMQMKMKNED